MRHRVHKRHFNRDTNARKALMTGLLRQLVLHGAVVTTQAKSKELKRQADKIISRAKKDTIAVRRLLHRTFGKRDVVNTLVERIAPKFPERNSGFTTNRSLGKRRGDNVELVKVSLLEMPERVGTLKSDKTHEPAVKKAKPAKKEVAKKVSKAAKADKPVVKKKAAPKKVTKEAPAKKK